MYYKLNKKFMDYFDQFETTKHAKIKDSGDVYIGEFELAGFSKDDIEIVATDDDLQIHAKNENREKKFNLTLYSAVSISDISSETKDGLLTVTMPKKCVSEQVKIKVK